MFTQLKPHIGIIQFDYCNHISSNEAGSSNSWPKSKKYGENDARKTCWLRHMPYATMIITNFNFLTWPFLSPYFYKPHFTTCTIHLANPSTLLRWFCEVLWWSINVFSHNFWNSPHNFLLWFMNISTKMLN